VEQWIGFVDAKQTWIENALDVVRHFQDVVHCNNTTEHKAEIAFCTGSHHPAHKHTYLDMTDEDNSMGPPTGDSNA
jgi:hypothetical protein